MRFKRCADYELALGRGTHYLDNTSDLSLNMQLSVRVMLLTLGTVAITITGCASSLPDLPRELNTSVDVNQPVQSEPVASSAPATPPPPPAVPIASAPTALPPAPELAPPAPAPQAAPAATPPAESAIVTLIEDSSAETESGIRVLHKASYNPFDRDNGKSFRALNTLAIYRSELGRHSIETTKPVDFTTSQVLVSSIGAKPTGGYTVSATNIEEFDDNIVVTVVQTIPGPSCITTQGVTHPFEFVVVPSRKPIEIFERQRVNDC